MNLSTFDISRKQSAIGRNCKLYCGLPGLQIVVTKPIKYIPLAGLKCSNKIFWSARYMCNINLYTFDISRKSKVLSVGDDISSQVALFNSPFFILPLKKVQQVNRAYPITISIH